MNDFRTSYTPAPDSGGGERDPNTLTLDQIVKAQIQQESSGRAGQIGPKTRWGGRARGLMQVQPRTGAAMAKKLGIEWRPDLMVGTTPEAADYQVRIGRAYMEESLDAYDGDVRMALRRYQGGPNTKIWGKENAEYPDKVLRYVDWDAAPEPAPQPARPPAPAVVSAANGEVRIQRSPQPAPARRPSAAWHPQLLHELLPHLRRIGRAVGSHVADVMDQSPLYERRRGKSPTR